MKRLTLKPGAVFTLAVLAGSSCLPAQDGRHASGVLFADGSLSGVIRDTDGVPQMGALVQALLPDATPAGSAITDARGRYHFSLQPGNYRIRATAALLLPAIRERLKIGRGTRAVVDLTLTTVLAPSGWLPAARRSVGEPTDDWMWTLRSSANRSILRYAGLEDTPDQAGDGSVVSSSREQSRRGASSGRITVKDSDGGFGRGGSHNVLMLTRLNEDGSGAILRADMSSARTPYPVAPSAEISVGVQHKTPLNGFNRAVLTYSGHPELVDVRGNTGMQGATLRSVQRIEFGDMLRVDAGSVMRDSNLGGNALVVEPFLRVAARAGDGVIIAYSMTHARGTESAEDLDRVQPSAPVAVYRHGHMQLETGSHHALSVQGKVPGGGTLELALYRDTLRNPMIAGTGNLSAADLQGNGTVSDPTTHTYRIAAKDYTSTGARLTAHQPITKSLGAGVELTSGQALRGARLQDASLGQVLNGLQPRYVYAATAFVDGKLLRTGTTVRAAYRWQPQRTLTTVDAFRIGDDGAYLSCSLRQSLGKTHVLPQGLEAVVDLQNLFAEGYQPFLSADGQALYLAQTPRTLQAGLSFSF